MFLLRHGQSYFNLHFTATKRDPGIEDPELTELGHQQARAAAQALQGAGITRVIVSPYTRALQTAEPFLALPGVTAEVLHEVRERTAFVCDIGSPLPCWRRAFPTMSSGICRRAGGMRRPKARRRQRSAPGPSGRRWRRARTMPAPCW
ncbi:histidine phosphatase family protein [Acidocella sp. MX-AZ03]|uniref:histidine phosphatase family protein n=1 Tax=Acidocella sp. MX-AZ03 TaxID=2697363 RepID=UPI002FD7AD91